MVVNIFDKKNMQRYLIAKHPELKEAIQMANFSDLQMHIRKLFPKMKYNVETKLDDPVICEIQATCSESLLPCS